MAQLNATLHDLISCTPEHPVPYAGDVVHLVYEPERGPVGVSIATEANGWAVMTIVAPAAEMNRSLDLARDALIRSTGNDPTDPASLARAHAAVGQMEFMESVFLLAKQRLFSLAVMRTRILPFLAPQYMRTEGPRAGQDYSFQVRMRLRPCGELSSFEPLHLAFPPRPEVGEEQVDERVKQMMGGELQWGKMPEEARDALGRLRDNARAQIAEENEAAWRSVLSDACSDALAERLTAEPPLAYVELLRNEMANQYAANVEAGGTRWEDHISSPGFDMEDFKAEMTENARRALRRGLALDAYAEYEGISLDEDDVLAAVSPVAQGHEREAAQAMLDGGQLAQLYEVSLRAKTADLLAQGAVDESAAGE